MGMRGISDAESRQAELSQLGSQPKLRDLDRTREHPVLGIHSNAAVTF
jgi:hypothetical protein